MLISFVILSSPSYTRGEVHRCVEYIYNCGASPCNDIVLCGGPEIQASNLKYIEADGAHNGIKRVSAYDAARHNTICFLNPRVLLLPGWLKAWSEFGNNWDFGLNRIFKVKDRSRRNSSELDPLFFLCKDTYKFYSDGLIGFDDCDLLRYFIWHNQQKNYKESIKIVRNETARVLQYV